ncbi:Rdx family-domain-containing protein [Daldinia decipiens]|uniref:Rdx family-domain-containing protein n=1 Tax=Daldinia decipiens TaxID=326647 RepID=UPI0020C43736|nr:Rdx family-domain-containing protein [Daldinia decipiens]KAI1661693.1 Rdx family-domain-containing protein [Daldinia decipiens]
MRTRPSIGLSSFYIPKTNSHDHSYKVTLTMAETSTSTSTSTPGPASPLQSPFPLPRITIRFCTQCKWMLRAAYFAQELLSTFSTSLGEVALQPSTGGTFVVEIFFQQPNNATHSPPTTQQRVLWDRKTDGGFPETKELKRRVRDAIEPGRDLGHVDKDYSSSKAKTGAAQAQAQAQGQQGTREGGIGAGNAPAAAPSKAEHENALGLNTHPGETIGGPACKPTAESTRTNAATQDECEDCK